MSSGDLRRAANGEFGMSDLINRRKAIGKIVSGLCVASGFVACERHRYIRPAEELDLGKVKSLLYRQVHLPEKSVLVFRDVDGWSVLSTRCTYRGCDLTFQDPVLLCSCCRTRFTLEGVPHSGWPATRPLPWLNVTYRDGNLYASTDIARDKEWRFTTPNIEKAIRELRLRSKEEGFGDETKIPDVLIGKGDREVGGMFVEENPLAIFDRKMHK